MKTKNSSTPCRTYSLKTANELESPDSNCPNNNNFWQSALCSDASLKKKKKKKKKKKRKHGLIKPFFQTLKLDSMIVSNSFNSVKVLVSAGIPIPEMAEVDGVPRRVLRSIFIKRFE